jgi:hypothetical protein
MHQRGDGLRDILVPRGNLLSGAKAMAKTTYSRSNLGSEVQAPWGYYQAQEEGHLAYSGRQVLYTLGSACIEASCCGKGSWNYARVEGYVDEAGGHSDPAGMGPVEVDTVEDFGARAAITKLLGEEYPGVRVEFR